MAKRILVVGDSFVGRLNAWSHLPGPFSRNFGFPSERFTFEFVARAGARIRDVLALPNLAEKLSRPPDLVVILMGGNDLCSVPADDVARELFSFAGYLHHGYSVPRVLCFRILPRLRPRGTTVDMFRRAVQRCNNLLLRRGRSHTWFDIRSLGGMMGSLAWLYEEDGRLSDGVHPSMSVGRGRLLRAFHSAVSEASRRYWPQPQQSATEAQGNLNP